MPALDGWTDRCAGRLRGSFLSWGGSAAAPSLPGCSGHWLGPGAAPPAHSDGHSLSESVSYCEQSSGLGSSSQAWWGPARGPLPVGSPGGGGEAMTPACSRMIRGL